MPSVTFGDLSKLQPPKPTRAKRKRKPAAPEVEVTHPALLPRREEPALLPEQRIAVALATFGKLIEARRELAQTMVTLRQIDADALDDPANAGHPQLDQMRAYHAELVERERQAWIKAIELGNMIGGTWEHLTPDQRRRSGLATLLEVDADAPRILFDLWHEACPIDLIAPLPEPWQIPVDLGHLVGRLPEPVTTYDAAELLRADLGDAVPF